MEAGSATPFSSTPDVSVVTLVNPRLGRTRDLQQVAAYQAHARRGGGGGESGYEAPSGPMKRFICLPRGLIAFVPSQSCGLTK